MEITSQKHDTKDDKKNEPFSLKRPIETQERLSPDFKKQKMLGHTDAPVAKLRLSQSPFTKKAGEATESGEDDHATSVESITAEAGNQPRRQP